jgi:hypothetical protein
MTNPLRIYRVEIELIGGSALIVLGSLLWMHSVSTAYEPTIPGSLPIAVGLGICGLLMYALTDRVWPQTRTFSH